MLNRMEIRDIHGVRTESTYVFVTLLASILDRSSTISSLHRSMDIRRTTNPSPTYYERSKEAFVTEVNAFTDAVLDDTRKSTVMTPPT